MSSVQQVISEFTEDANSSVLLDASAASSSNSSAMSQLSTNATTLASEASGTNSNAALDLLRDARSLAALKVGASNVTSWLSAIEGERKEDSTPPLALTGTLGLCLALAVSYLMYLWHQRGLVSHIVYGLLSPSSAPAATALLVYLVMLVSVDLLIKHEAELGHGEYSTSPFLLVPLVEFGKFTISAMLCLLSTFLSWAFKSPSLPAGLLGAAEEEQCPWEGAPQVAKLMLPVAMLYNLNNVLNLVVLAHVRLDAYAVWRNMSILFNAVIWVWVLSRAIEFHRWVAVGICLLGSCFNTLGTDGTIIVDVALSGVLFSALLSSVASVFNERVIKSPEAALLSINQVNLLLYAETLSLMLLAFLGSGLARGFPPPAAVAQALTSITPGAWKIIGMQVAMGLTVSRVLKHADAVAKTVVGSLRDVALVFIGPHVVLAARADAIAVGSACLVGVAGMVYSMPAAAAAAAGGAGPAKDGGGGARSNGPRGQPSLLACRGHGKN